MKNRKIHSSLHLTVGQLVLIVVLVVAFAFFCSFWMLRSEYTSDQSYFITYWGFPFEAIKIKYIVGEGGVSPDVGRFVYIGQTYEYLWNGIIMNIIIYIILSITVVKLAIWIRDEIEYRRFYKL